MKLNNFLNDLKNEFLNNDLLKYAIIRKKGRKWVLYDSKGKKILGIHKTKKEALRQEKAIQISKKRRFKK